MHFSQNAVLDNIVWNSYLNLSDKVKKLNPLIFKIMLAIKTKKDVFLCKFKRGLFAGSRYEHLHVP